MITRRAFGLASLATFALPALAAFPDKPIRILVGFAAGGPADTCARLVARLLSSRWWWRTAPAPAARWRPGR